MFRPPRWSSHFHFGFGPGGERANLISSRWARRCTPSAWRLSSVAIAVALSPAAPIDRSSPSSSGVHGGPGALISSLFSASWRGSDSIRVLLFSLTLRSGRAILRYNPRLLSSWPTSSTDAPRLRSIVEAVESSFRLRLQPVLAVHQLNNRARYERFMVGSAASLHEPDFQLGGSTLHRHQ